MATTANAYQREFWNEDGGRKWVEYQDSLDAQLVWAADKLVAIAGANDGDGVLDIGCGCGGTSLRFAEVVGGGGRVTGADISDTMLIRARERAQEAGLSNIEFVHADAQTHDFAPAAYDLATSRFGVMFFDDPVAAFANIRSALKPGGRLAFVCWRPPQENPWIMVPMTAAAQHVELPAPAAPGTPGPFAFADAERTRGILEAAGFSEIAVDAYDTESINGAGGTLEESVEYIFNIGPLSPIVRDASPTEKEAVRASVLDALAPYYTPKGIKMEVATWAVTARNA